MQLTTSELIKLLQKYDGNVGVYLEGCDCYGSANGVQGYGKEWKDKVSPKDAAIVLITIDDA